MIAIFLATKTFYFESLGEIPEDPNAPVEDAAARERRLSNEARRASVDRRGSKDSRRGSKDDGKGERRRKHR